MSKKLSGIVVDNGQCQIGAAGTAGTLSVDDLTLTFLPPGWRIEELIDPYGLGPGPYCCS